MALIVKTSAMKKVVNVQTREEKQHYQQRNNVVPPTTELIELTDMKGV